MMPLMAGPVLLHLLWERVHIYTFFLWWFLASQATLESHTKKDCAEEHEAHHRILNGNYGSTTIFPYLFGSTRVFAGDGSTIDELHGTDLKLHPRFKWSDGQDRPEGGRVEDK